MPTAGTEKDMLKHDSYRVLSGRLASALTHANAYSPKRQRAINAKINKLEKLCEGRRGLARRYFSPELNGRIHAWRDRRNTLVHELMSVWLAPGDVEDVAREGEQIVKELKSKVGGFNRASDRTNARA